MRDSNPKHERGGDSVMQESYMVYEAWVCLDRQSNTCSQKDLLCSNMTMSHFLEFRPLVGTVASIANVISQLVPSKLICRVSVTCQLCCGDSPQTLGPTDESPSQHPLGGQRSLLEVGDKSGDQKEKQM